MFREQEVKNVYYPGQTSVEKDIDLQSRCLAPSLCLGSLTVWLSLSFFQFILKHNTKLIVSFGSKTNTSVTDLRI